jgi:hypothetical protein
MNTPKIAALALVLGLTPAAAFAQKAVDQEMLKRFCTGDYLEHCGEHPPGGPEVEACFRRKAKVLSPNCSAAIVAYRPVPGIRNVSATR